MVGSEKEIAKRGLKILGEINKLSDLMEKKRYSKTDKIEMRRRLNNCEGLFRSLLFYLTT